MYFSIPKMKNNVYAKSECANSGRISFRFENPMAQVVSKIGRLGPQIFKSENGTVSCFKMLSTQASSSRTSEDLDGDTRLYSDVASRPTRSRRSTRLSVARLPSAGAGSSLKTKRSALGAHAPLRGSRRLQQQRSVCLRSRLGWFIVSK